MFLEDAGKWTPSCQACSVVGSPHGSDADKSPDGSCSNESSWCTTMERWSMVWGSIRKSPKEEQLCIPRRYGRTGGRAIPPWKGSRVRARRVALISYLLRWGRARPERWLYAEPVNSLLAPAPLCYRVFPSRMREEFLGEYRVVIRWSFTVATRWRILCEPR